MSEQSDGSCDITSDTQFLGKMFKKHLFLFLQAVSENTLWVETTVIPTTMTRCAFYPIAGIEI